MSIGLRAPVLLAIALLGPIIPPDPAAAQPARRPHTARSRYFEQTEDEKADPSLQGRERDRVLRKRASLRLVVMISGQLGDAPTLGAGIIFGRAKGKLHIVTANHVVRRASAAARDIKVRLRDIPDTPLNAEVTPHFNLESDIAVLEAHLPASGQFDPCSLFLFQLTDGPHLKRGDNVISVGNPQGIGWGMSVTPEVIASVERDKLLFQSTFLSPGHSGGALIEADGGIIGMIQSDQHPYGVARRFTAIIPELRRWNYIVELYRRRLMPQNDYHLLESALEEAAAQGDLTVLDTLLQACPDVNEFTFEMRTPLHIAAMHGQAGVVSRLITLGANLNVQANTRGLVGYTPLDLAAGYGHAEVVKILLAAGADPKGKGDDTPLHSAAGGGHVDVVRVLARNRALLEIVTPGAGTPLHRAVRNKRLDAASALLEAGAPPNAKDSQGRTSLHIAVNEEFFAAIPMLLQAGADAEATDNDGEKPLDMVSDRVKRREVAEMFRSAAKPERRQR